MWPPTSLESYLKKLVIAKAVTDIEIRSGATVTAGGLLQLPLRKTR
jgi:hypothetical protein